MMNTLDAEKAAVLVITGFIAVLMAATLARSGVDQERGKKLHQTADRTMMSGGEPAAVEPSSHRPVLIFNDDEDDARRSALTPQNARADEHIVRAGDSLEQIALDRLGSRRHVAAIRAKNPGVDPLRLRVGDRLTLPTNVEDSVSDQKSGQKSSQVVHHVVKSGETLGDIARQHYGRASAWRKLFEANRDVIKDPDRVLPSTRLAIPGS